MNQIITIAEVGIRVDAKGRYCLNDLHRAAGGESKHEPHQFMRLDQTQALVEEINSADQRISVQSKRGANGGTFVARELVYAYAMWISPAFHLKVIRAYDKAMTDMGDWRKLRHQSASSFKVANDILKMVRQEQGKTTESHHFSNEARLVNWALAGEFKGLDRDAMSAADLALLAHLEERNAVLIGRGIAYDQRKPMLKQYAMDFRMARTSPQRLEA